MRQLAIGAAWPHHGSLRWPKGLNGKTIGRRYVGPTWELTDGSAVTGKAVSNAPGATAVDIPLLKLDVVNHQGNSGSTPAAASHKVRAISVAAFLVFRIPSTTAS